MSQDQINTLVSMVGASVTLAADGVNYSVTNSQGATSVIAAADFVEALNGLAALVASTLSSIQNGANVMAASTFLSTIQVF